MSDNPASGSGETPQSLPQHPLVARLKPDPSQPAQHVIELAGLPGDSDRAGYQRLYLTARLDYYAEFLAQDVVYSETVPADASPVAGQEATKAGIRRDATISYTWVRSPQPVDEFDLDVRLGPAIAVGPAPVITLAPRPSCPLTHCDNTCAGNATCPNTQCNTCPDTCTCLTRCRQHTCVSCVTCGACTRGNNLTCAVGNCGGPI